MSTETLAIAGIFIVIIVAFVMSIIRNVKRNERNRNE